MTDDRQQYWFPAKHYGWGWGLPRRWQGWVVFILYFLLVAVSAAFFLPNDNVTAFVVCTAVLTVALMAVCWIKGEKPEWRWGNK